MSKELDALLGALAAAKGETIQEKMASLVAGGDVFSVRPQVAQTWARGVDRVSMTWSQVIEAGGLDVQAAALSRRLREVGSNVSPMEVREHPHFWNERMVSEMEDGYRRTRELPHRRRLRVAR